MGLHTELLTLTIADRPLRQLLRAMPSRILPLIVRTPPLSYAFAAAACVVLGADGSSWLAADFAQGCVEHPENGGGLPCGQPEDVSCRLHRVSVIMDKVSRPPSAS